MFEKNEGATRLKGMHKRFQEAVDRTISWLDLLDLEEEEIDPKNLEQTKHYLKEMLKRYVPVSADEEYIMSYGVRFIVCPQCGAKHVKAKYRYCPWCGQALGRKVYLTDEDFFY